MWNFPIKIAFCLLVWLGGGAVAVWPQEKTDARPAGVITGTVIVDDDLPLDELRVAAGSAIAEVKKNGGFRLEQVPPDAREVRVIDLPAGYVQVSATVVKVKSGAELVLRVARGGVITGRLTEEDGSPAVLVQVLATLARDAEGKPTLTTFATSAFTDDRGVYRLYGLPAGGYHLAVGGKGQEVWGSIPDSQPLFYYPSGDFAAATPVAVRLGQEVTGLDFPRRRRASRQVSGVITNSPAELAGPQLPVNVWLVRSGGRIEFAANAQEKEGRLSFTFADVIDGEYELIAEMPGPVLQAAAPPQHLSVNGTNVSDLSISLTLLGEVSGRVTRVADPAASRSPDCATQSAAPAWTEFSALASHSGPNGPETIILSYFAAEPGLRLDENGGFRLRGLRPGPYRLRLGFPGPNWYVRSVKAPGATPQAAPKDIGAQGFTIADGKKLDGVEVVVDNSAAIVQGRVTIAGEKSAIPENLWVYLLPAEKEQTENLLRYAETQVGRDGIFAFANRAPGRYLVVAVPQNRLESVRRPVSRQLAARAQLRREAETAKREITLKPCQRVVDFNLPYEPAQ